MFGVAFSFILAISVTFPNAARAEDAATLAKLFGARPAMTAVSMSPHGDRVLYLSAVGGRDYLLVVADVATGATRTIMRSQGESLQFSRCYWANDERIICNTFGQTELNGKLVTFTRVLALNSDGSKVTELGRRSNSLSLNVNLRSGRVIDLLPDDPRHVLMAIYVYPEFSTGSRFAKKEEGLTVQKVDIYTGQKSTVEGAFYNAATYMTDTTGKVRLVGIYDYDERGYLRDYYRYMIRRNGNDQWLPFARTKLSDDGSISVEGFDESGNEVYFLNSLDGRLALYRRSLVDDSDTLVFAHPRVDVDSLVVFGQTSRPVGAYYTDEYDRIEYFDPAVKRMAASLAKALPGRTVNLLDESWDGNRVLVFGWSDRDPGAFYIYDKTLHQLIRLSSFRPELDGRELSEVKPIEYPAADGTMIPAYLTLPPGHSSKPLPLVVMPHGGPSARDSWGFDWLPQFLALSGYAVLQPNYRGSAGFGSDWKGENAFKSWKLAIGDINDGARWAVKSGIADASRLAIVGWSYGGYAALQANVVEPSLYKAVAAIAPVTDLQRLKDDAKSYSNAKLVAKFVGSGPHLVEGSPAQNAAKIVAPVEIFFGTKDVNVDVGQGRAMQKALQAAGKRIDYVEYEGLTHSLNDTDARTDMLTKIGNFLAENVR